MLQLLHISLSHLELTIKKKVTFCDYIIFKQPVVCKICITSISSILLDNFLMSLPATWDAKFKRFSFICVTRKIASSHDHPFLKPCSLSLHLKILLSFDICSLFVCGSKQMTVIFFALQKPGAAVKCKQQSRKMRTLGLITMLMTFAGLGYCIYRRL